MLARLRAVSDPRATCRAAATGAAAGDEVPHQLTGRAREIELLLRERRARSRRSDVEVTVPRHLSASKVVAFARDREAFALDLRRPMPAPPAVAARRGTAFHAWVEQHFAQAAMVDLLDLPGSADEDPGDDSDLPLMKEHFLASEWASRTPEAIETAIETIVDGIAVRGRIDAVFRRADGGFTVVDWKTGARPSGEQARRRGAAAGGLPAGVRAPARARPRPGRRCVLLRRAAARPCGRCCPTRPSSSACCRPCPTETAVPTPGDRGSVGRCSVAGAGRGSAG